MYKARPTFVILLCLTSIASAVVFINRGPQGIMAGSSRSNRVIAGSAESNIKPSSFHSKERALIREKFATAKREREQAARRVQAVAANVEENNKTVARLEDNSATLKAQTIDFQPITGFIKPLPAPRTDDVVTDDERVAVTSTNTAGYIGQYSTNGVLRTDASISYAYGGDFVTLSTSNYVDNTVPGIVTNILDATNLVSYNSIYGIYNISAVAGTFTIRGGAYASAIAGAFKTVSSYNGTITATAWVYLTVERTSGTATISAAATPPSPDDDTEIFPLWYLPWSGGIDTGNIIDYRYTKHWVGGS